MAEPYHGPQCPHCQVTLADSVLHTGTIACPACGKSFEATAFQPRELRIVAPELVGVGPEEGSACANHARNAAVASCQRCGIFICSLCEMNTGAGVYCPSCFDRARSDNSFHVGAKRYRNYTSMGVLCVISGTVLWFLCIPAGALAIYYGVKDVRQRRERQHSIVPPVLVILLGLAQSIGGLVVFGSMFLAITKV